MLLYADEDFAFPAVAELQVRVHDALTAQEDGQTAMPDAVILARVFALVRVVFERFAATDACKRPRRTQAHTIADRARYCAVRGVGREGPSYRGARTGARVTCVWLSPGTHS